MRKIIGILAFFSVLSSFAQQAPMYSHSSLLPIFYNPAYNGLEKELAVNLLHRSQWSSITGAPVSNVLQASSSFKEKNGLGLNVLYDTRGITTTVNATGSYAYHARLTNNHYLSFGVSAGLLNQQVNFSEAIVQDANDPIVLGGNVSGSTFLVDFGLLYRFKHLEVGIAIPQLVGHQNAAVYNDLKRYFIGNFSYEWGINEQLIVKPIVLIRQTVSSPLQYDISAIAFYRDLVWGGVGYRSAYAVNISAGIKIKSFELGYSYDIVTNELAGNGVSHEILLRFVRPHKEKDEEIKEEEIIIEEIEIDTLVEEPIIEEEEEELLITPEDAEERIIELIEEYFDLINSPYPNENKEYRLEEIDYEIDALLPYLDDNVRESIEQQFND